MSNNNILLITMGLTCDGLNSFTITGRNWIKLDKWMRHYDLESSDKTMDATYYKIAENITPKQQEKFVYCYDLNHAQNYILDLIYGPRGHNAELAFNGKERGEWLEDKESKDRYYEKEKAKKVLEEMDVEKWNPRSVGGKLDFDRRAKEDGIVWDEE